MDTIIEEGVAIKTKPWYQSRTLWIAAAQGVLGIVLVLETSLPQVGWIAILKTFLDILIRVTGSSALTVTNMKKADDEGVDDISWKR